MLRVTILEGRCPIDERQDRVKYTKEFKEDAVKLVLEQEYSASEAGRRHGVNQPNVSRWVREFRRDQQEAAGGGRSRAESWSLR